MKTLRPNTRSEEVKDLQLQLRRLGFTITDPDGFFGGTTRRAVQRLQRDGGLPNNGEVVDEATFDVLHRAQEGIAGRVLVRGRVVDAAGNGIRGLTVRAFDIQFDQERLLGVTLTDESGGYLIRYEAGDEPTDLQVRVFENANARRPAISSPLLLNAKPDQEVNLAPGGGAFPGRNEFAEVRDVLETLVEGVDIRPSPADARSTFLLSRRSGLSEPQVGHYLMAREVADSTRLRPAVIYGLLRQSAPADPSGLLAESTELQRQRLMDAAARNVIDRREIRELDAVIEALQAAGVERELAVEEQQGEGLRLREMLATTSLSDDQRRRFLHESRRNAAPAPEFWDRLRADPLFNAQSVDELQLTLQLAALSLGHPPLVRAVKAQRNPVDARELAELELEDWVALIANIDPPAAFGEVEGEEEPRRRYARTVMRVVAKAFPTPRLLARWNRDPELATDDLRTFHRNNPEFEFRDATVRRYLQGHPEALRGVAEPDGVTRQLEAMHRIFSLISSDEKFDLLRPLWGANLTSAHSIVRTGEPAFLRRFEQSMGREGARQVFAAARMKTAVSLAALVQFSPLFGGIDVGVAGNFQIEDPPEGIPDWRTLFGSPDFCQCQHCRSILSPAAYFVDLLQFLERADRGERNGLEALLDHRPDLAHIRLDCENTNTVMPYIDLANEVLENAAVHGAFSLSVSPAFQTRGPAEDLRANPQNLIPAAYETLAEETFPWSLPFNLWHEERRVYLGHLGIEPWELMETFHREGEEPEPIDRAASFFGLTRLERQIITGEAGAGHGLGSTDVVPSLMRNSQMTLAELQESLQSQFINPEAREVEFSGDTCDLEDARLDLSGAERDRLHRFRRLQKASGWSVFELDLIIQLLGGNQLTSSLLVQAAYLRRLQQRVRLSVPELLSWWSPVIPSRADADKKSLYEELFLNPTVTNPLDPLVQIFGLNSAGTQLATTGELLDGEGHLNGETGPLLAGGLGISEEDLRLLIDEILPTSQLNLRNLSHLFRVASLSRALRIGVGEYLALRRLTGEPGLSSLNRATGAFVAATPEQTWNWIELHDRLRRPGFGAAELEYILLHRIGRSFTPPIDDAGARLVLRDLQAEMRKLPPVAEVTDDPEPAVQGELEEWLLQKLALVTAEPEEALRITLGNSSLSVPEQTTFVTEELAGFLIPSEFLAITAGTGRLVFAYRALLAFLGRTLIIQHLAAQLRVEVSVAAQLLERHLHHPDDSARPALDVFQEAGFLTADFSSGAAPAPVPPAVRVLRQFGKIAFVLRQLEVKAGDVSELMESGPARGWRDLRNLPSEEVTESAELDSWIRMVEALDLSRRLFPGEFSIFQLFAVVDDDTQNGDTTLSALSERTGWDLESLRFLAGASGYGFAFPGDFREARWLQRLEEAFSLMRKAGVSGAQIWSWNIGEATPSLALKIKAAAKARHTAEQWLKVAPALADQLRKARRDHLVDFLIARHNEFETADDLYERLLIDPQVEPCFLTSRIKQAISSVQLFVQRTLLSLEPEVRFSDEEAAEWQWRKHYRVREAALKVLLMPENFVEPELRDAKSPFFRELEQRLLQEEVTSDSVEQAYSYYLRSLDEVARMEMSGLFIEDSGPNEVVHIFARTRARPPMYYYRRWVRQSYFTPWEPVDVKIEGDHLIPVVYNRRLWLIWPVFEEHAVEPGNLGAESKPKKYYRIRLSWSQYRSGKWTSPKTSKTYIATDTNRYGKKHRYYFWAEVTGDALYVHHFYNEVVTEWDWAGEAGVGGVSSIGLNRWQRNRLFAFTGCSEEPLVYHYSGPSASLQRKEIPYRTNFASAFRNMKFEQKGTLSMFSYIASDGDGVIIEAQSPIEVILKRAPHPGYFEITPPHQYLHFFSQSPFFCENRDRAFLVVPEDVVDSGPSGTVMMRKDQLDMVMLGSVPTAHTPPVRHERESNRLLVRPDSGTPGSAFTIADAHVVIDQAVTGLVAEDETDPEQPPEPGDAFLMETPFLGDEGLGQPHSKKKYHFRTFYHPYTCLFIEQLNRFGVDGLLAPSRFGKGLELHRQLTPGSDFRFSPEYNPISGVVAFGHPVEEIEFRDGGAYSEYNWEVFFHIPLLIASRLSQNQRFEEAQRWFHYIFDPTETDDEGLDADERFRKFWKVKPLYQASSRENVEQVLRLINEGDPAFEKQVAEWELDPFNPHLIARLRPVAYMKAVVMKYLDNLIAWADGLFQRDTIETVNEATQLYVLAGRILGRKPVEVPRTEPAARTYLELSANLDALSNSLVTLENLFFVNPNLIRLQQYEFIDMGTGGSKLRHRSSAKLAPMVRASTISATAVIGASMSFITPAGRDDPDEPENPLRLYFCPPRNDKLLAYWDTVADRLYKIRNCLNIEGVRRTLALFEPPINPALLVKASAAGVDLQSALDDLNAPLPHYRFSFVLQRALDFCNDVKALGGAMLAAIEKKDAEALALLRGAHEPQLLRAIRLLKERAIDEAEEGVAALEASYNTAEFRRNFYRQQQQREAVPGRPGLLASEVEQEISLEEAQALQMIGQGYDLAANIAYLFPDIKLGVQGMSSPEITATLGGSFFGRAFQAFGSVFRLLASISSHKAQMASIRAGYERRAEEWNFQESLAVMERRQIERQIIAAQVRVAMAQRDLKNHELQIEQSDEVETFLREKFTNEQRYGQLMQELSTVYFQSYQLAFDLAKRAERCFRFELGVENTNFIEFGYWDSLKKGLLTGERLYKDLRRLESAYIEQNRREYEITQHFALTMLDAEALLALRETGSCEFDIPEIAYDLVYPGHYMRRIKSVGVTIPCVTGPYTNVNARLTLLRNRVRVNGNSQAEYAYTGLDDPNFRHDLIGIQSIATSTAQNDTGVFQFSFQDERYLPFERAGAVSRWSLSLPAEFRSFDYDTISDVIVHVSYTAREGGDALRATVEQHVGQSLNLWLDELAQVGVGLNRLISLRREFPNALHRLLFPGQDQAPSCQLGIGLRHFPYFLRNRQLTLTQLLLVVKPREGAGPDGGGLAITFQGDAGSPAEFSQLSGFSWSGRQEAIEAEGTPWEFEVTAGTLGPERIEDICLLLSYTVA